MNQWELKVTLSNGVELVMYLEEPGYANNVMHNWRVAHEGQVMLWSHDGVIINVPYHAVAFWWSGKCKDLS